MTLVGILHGPYEVSGLPEISSESNNTDNQEYFYRKSIVMCWSDFRRGLEG
jgi:hypothetical protein